MTTKKTTTTAVAVTSVAAGVTAAAIATRRRSSTRSSDLQRWRVVTVNRDRDHVDGSTPQPLAALGSAVEVQTSAAPGDKGTELRARWRAGADLPDHADPAQVLRSALRESKQLLEVGWVLQPDHNVTTEETPWNAPLRKAVKVARGEGLL